jgi:pimeloyl-ACP methyl ester carboxylesterase
MDTLFSILSGSRRSFAGDLPKQQAEFEANAQVFTASAAFSTPIRDAAWRTKPSWYLVARSDRIINPDLERMYAKRANSTTVEIEGASHSVYASHPVEVAKLIVDAAKHAGANGASSRVSLALQRATASSERHHHAFAFYPAC